MEIRRAERIEGARSAKGVVVVIDVIRAFTTAARAFASGAREVFLVDSADAAFELRKRMPGAFLMGEIGGARVPGFDHGNSPAEFPTEAVRGRRVIQSTGSGTRCAVAAAGAETLFVASLSVAGATARAIGSPPLVTLVASMGDVEGDDAVGDYLQGLLDGGAVPAEDVIRRVRESEAGRKIASGAYPQYPREDLDHCTRVDAHDFAMRARRDDGLLVVTAFRP